MPALQGPGHHILPPCTILQRLDTDALTGAPANDAADATDSIGEYGLERIGTRGDSGSFAREGGRPGARGVGQTEEREWAAGRRLMCPIRRRAGDRRRLAAPRILVSAPAASLPDR